MKSIFWVGRIPWDINQTRPHALSYSVLQAKRPGAPFSGGFSRATGMPVIDFLFFRPELRAASLAAVGPPLFATDAEILAGVTVPFMPMLPVG